MRWRFRIGIIVTNMAFFLVVAISWTPVSLAYAQAVILGAATPTTITVQATPTEDATVTALNKEQLAQQVAGQQHTLGNWLWSNAATLSSTLVIVIGALFGLWRWRRDQHTDLEKRAEERFQAAVTGLGDEKEGAKVGAAITLRTFLRPSYEQFYTQTFDLAVAHLRLLTTSTLLEDPTPPLPPLSQALIVIFKEAFPLARSQNKGSPQSLDATGIQLDYAYLRASDLEQVWMPQASLRKADLVGARLIRADLSEANLSGATLVRADLSGARLIMSDLSGAILIRADLSEANLREANLSGATFREANLGGTNLEEVLSLKGADLRGAKGLTKEGGFYLSPRNGVLVSGG